ncbi:Probable protein phosphatase 2C 6 [Linum grandiflorum]
MWWRLLIGEIREGLERDQESRDKAFKKLSEVDCRTTGMQLEKVGRDPACSMGVDCFFSIARAFGTSCFTDEGTRGSRLRKSAGSNSAEAAKRKKKRQLVMKRSDSKLEVLLHRVPGRLFLNSSSDCASLFTKPGKKGVNQDAMIFWEAFNAMDKELQLHPYIDSFCSGTTAVTMIKQGQDLVIGNIGDSRAVLGTRDKGNTLIAVQLTEDLKPSLPREAERIRQCKGRVFALPNEPDIARIWLPNSNSPGLAMTRAFGDFCLKNFGLISVPEISYHRITDKDEFVVLATDGVWDVLSNDEVVSIVASVSPSSAAQTLVEFAHRAWRTKYPTSKTDDCAAVCLFLSSSKMGIA